MQITLFIDSNETLAAQARTELQRIPNVQIEEKPAGFLGGQVLFSFIEHSNAQRRFGPGSIKKFVAEQLSSP
ncbi:MAG: hypothetical protein Q8P83_02075 [bacterium]|nr:hypothetical protein [bacterium]